MLITGSGKDGGIGQALALAAAANGAEVVGVHFHSSYRDGFDLVDAIRAHGVKAYAVQADVTNTRDMWASRSYIIEQNGGRGPDLIICNSGLTEKGYRFGRALPEIDGESRAERAATPANGGGSSPDAVYRFGTAEVNFDTWEVRVGGQPVRLTSLEMKLLKYLVDHEGKVVPRKELLEKVWGLTRAPATRTVDTFMLALRKYFEADPSKPVHFLSVRGTGYRFVAAP